MTENVVPIGASAAVGRVDAFATHPSFGGLGADARLVIERTTGGGLLVSSPDAPGWSTAAPDRVSLLRAVDEGFREAAIAQYAARRGQPYDVTLHDQAAEEAAAVGKVLPFDPDERDAMLGTLSCSAGPLPTVSTRAGDVHDPLAWRELTDGRWVSPSGRTYGPQTQVVRRVVEKRLNMGVGTTTQV